MNETDTITYSIHCGAGVIAKCIPSLDVAVIMATDIARYTEDDDDNQVRCSVSVDLGAEIEFGVMVEAAIYARTPGGHERLELCVNEVRHCPTCGQPRRSR